ncbi:MAG: glycosyltransferase family 2 protein [Candidatus Woesebacteria bacterium]|jgi:glycosyltransferase involved in cell wall biosynthesis
MLSVVLATYNEEKNIQGCLESVKDFADEIIVLDGSSQDRTREIAKKLGAKVFKTTNKLNFHINKQIVMNKAKGDLVLQLDADEVVDTELKKFIIKTHKNLLFLKKSSNKADFSSIPKAWWIKRKNLFLNKWLKKGGQYPDPVIRLYVNGYARLPQKDVHEQMIVNGQVAWAEGHLLHYSNPEFSNYLKKFNHYTSLKAKQLKAAKTKISFSNSFKYLVWKPGFTFLNIFIRHKGFVDGVAGFTFAFFSALHHSIAYLKLWELYESTN